MHESTLLHLEQQPTDLPANAEQVHCSLRLAVQVAHGADVRLQRVPDANESRQDCAAVAQAESERLEQTYQDYDFFATLQIAGPIHLEGGERPTERCLQAACAAAERAVLEVVSQGLS